ncbi:MAG: hypothetical protein ACPG5B_10020 [Chitinophagales bacterium]
MNYLSHYYVANCPSNPNYTLGLLLPDFVRKQTSKFRIANVEMPLLSASSQYFHRGVLCHYKTDALFHVSDFFKKHLANIQQEWKASNFESLHKYKFFLAHVLLEMMLDRILMQDEPKICISFYQHLANINKKEYEEYISKIGLSKAHSVQIFSAYERFIKNQYLHKYLDKTKFINGLSYVYQKVTHLKISNKDKHKLIDSLCNIELAMQADYEAFLLGLKSEISSFIL